MVAVVERPPAAIKQGVARMLQKHQPVAAFLRVRVSVQRGAGAFKRRLNILRRGLVANTQ